MVIKLSERNVCRTLIRDFPMPFINRDNFVLTDQRKYDFFTCLGFVPDVTFHLRKVEEDFIPLLIKFLS